MYFGYCTIERNNNEIGEYETSQFCGGHTVRWEAWVMNEPGHIDLQFIEKRSRILVGGFVLWGGGREGAPLGQLVSASATGQEHRTSSASRWKQHNVFTPKEVSDDKKS